MKRLFIALMLVLALVACSNAEELKDEQQEIVEAEKESESNQEDEVEREDNSGADSEDEPEAEEDDSLSWDDLKTTENIIGKSDKDFSEVMKAKPSEVRNDVTGNWRKVTLAENIDIEEYAKSYQELHMDEGETHFIINFNRKTTTVINEFNSLLYVDIHEYVEKEEHDANQLGSGMLLVSYVIYPDGDIEKIEE